MPFISAPTAAPIMISQNLSYLATYIHNHFPPQPCHVPKSPSAPSTRPKFLRTPKFSSPTIQN
ncbi:hypothetical protein BDD12DRAFT_849054 [Trichophaea hybrida]|nr:hypothetical protein BDD12DRAFT_849054 [Trichophaea hybrida]